MKHCKSLLALLVLLAATLSLQAQNGNGGAGNGNGYGNLHAVVSEVKITDDGHGTAMIEVRVSGNDADEIAAGTFVITGDYVRGGSYTSVLSGTRQLPGAGNEVMLMGAFPSLPNPGPQPGSVDIEIQLRTFGYEFGNSKRINGVVWGVVTHN